MLVDCSLPDWLASAFRLPGIVCVSLCLFEICTFSTNYLIIYIKHLLNIKLARFVMRDDRADLADTGDVLCKLVERVASPIFQSSSHITNNSPLDLLSRTTTSSLA